MEERKASDLEAAKGENRTGLARTVMHDAPAIICLLYVDEWKKSLQFAVGLSFSR
jgi:hypothetical protein